MVRAEGCGARRIQPTPPNVGKLTIRHGVFARTAIPSAALFMPGPVLHRTGRVGLDDPDRALR
ncbi:MAG TPA: hypothetical protein VJ650_03035 [Gemmatimonadaceae bacterium]|nr:hypothetical protein [Gemmatimonadaceae bacterium]